MPSKSKAEHNLMEAAKHSKEVRERTGISKKVADEFVKADKGKNVKKLPEHKKK
jgi:hypothetical protein